jgi:ABC-type antimicrobial peptide transport system permease subunit
VFWKLVLSNIQHSRVRVGLNCTLIAVPLTLALTLMGLNPPARDPPLSGQPSTHLTSSAVTRRTSAAVSDRSGFRPFLTVVVGVMLIFSVVATFLSMCANVLYRKQEIGIIRFLGGSKVFVIGIVSTEAALIGLCGAVFGVLFSQSLLHGLNFLSAAVTPYSIGWKWCLIMPGIVASTAVVSSLVVCSLSVRQQVLDMLDDDCG